MLKRNAELSRTARNLYGTLRALANGKTGQLKIKDRWLKATVFDRAAEMCRCIRLRAMRELIGAGLVTVERESVLRIIEDRRRVVWAGTRYTVHRQSLPIENHQNIGVCARPIPKTVKKPNVLPKSISSTVEEIDPQYLSNPPLGAGSVSVLPLNCSEIPPSGVSHHQHPATDDDDCGLPSKESSKPKPETKGKIPVEEIAERAPKTEIKLPVQEVLQEMSPALCAWMRSRILARGRDVRSPGAYLRASEPAFLENLNTEIEMFLTEKATELMRQRINKAGVVNFGWEFNDFLEAQSEKHGFDPNGFDVDPLDFLGRVYDSAADILGLRDVDESDAPPAAPAPEPPAPPVVRTPKKSRQRVEKKREAKRRREQAELERNRRRAQKKLDREQAELKRTRQREEAKLECDRKRAWQRQAEADELAVKNVRRDLTEEEMTAIRLAQREQLARAHPEWVTAVSPPASGAQQ